MSRGHGFFYDLAEDCLRISLGKQLVVCIPYERIERVERGWAPGLQVGGPGMPGRGDEVRVRADLPTALPWASMTPLDPDRFVIRLLARSSRARGVSGPEATAPADMPTPLRGAERHG